MLKVAEWKAQGGLGLLPAASGSIGRPAVQRRYKNSPCVCGGAKGSPAVSQCGFVFDGLFSYLINRPVLLKGYFHV